MTGWHTRLAMAVVAMTLLLGAAGATDKVVVRAAEHDGFARLVFDWPAPAPRRSVIANMATAGQLRRSVISHPPSDG